MRPILASVLFLACAREPVRGDLVTDYESYSNGTVKVAASSSSADVSPADYAGTAVFVPAPASLAAGAVLTNFVTLIRAEQGKPSGFVPKNLPFGSEDIRFFDQDGNVLPFEIDTWDDDDVSYFWVRVPRLSASSKITMCWGLRAGKTLPAYVPAAVWTDYAGVWHMSDEADSTANGAEGVFGSSALLTYGQVGKAAGTQVSGRKDPILEVGATEAIDALTNGVFTVSGWVYLNKTDVKSGALFSRATASDPAWGARFCGGTSGDSSKVELESGSASAQGTVDFPAQQWTRFDAVYASDRLAFYLGGERKFSAAVSGAVLNGSGGALAIGGLVSEAAGALGANTLNGFVDEFRLRAGAPDEATLAAERDQYDDEDFFTRQPVSWDESAILQNRWKVYPTCGKTEWDEGQEPTVFTNGVPWYGVSVLSYRDRASGETLAEMPTEYGDYRAVFFCAAVDNFSSLTYTIDFRIRKYRPTHDLGDGNDRILLLNGDESVSDGQVFAQSYADTDTESGRPYWWHDVDSGYDYTSASDYYNFCGGLRHTYYARGEGGERARLWDLIDIRYGNTYNNALAVEEAGLDPEVLDEGLADDMNYLPWNPEGGRLVDTAGFTAGDYHEFAAQAVFCNSLDASINSGLYTNGIGTIYFDAVNSHTDDATNGCYRLVVEVATNAVNPATGGVAGIPTDEAIAATQNDGETVTDPYKWAGWRRQTMHVKVVNGAVPEADTLVTNELTLALAGGGSYTNFYRIYIPVDCFGPARFRIRRTAVNPDYTITKDDHSLILADNVICSKPTGRLRVEPCGFYDATKVKRETVGYEGAFNPAYPSVSDSEIYARARVVSVTGEELSPGTISSVRMIYRWRYLNQQKTDWLTVDLEPSTLVSARPISWPMILGDLEYYFEANQSGEFYQYADYSGLGLGLPGYSEEVSTVEGRSPSYDGETDLGDWFTRIRDGQSAYGAIKLHVRRGGASTVETVDMFVARDRVWRGCLLATNAVSDGISFRFEGRNRQDDSYGDFRFNTNLWYFADAATALPVSGSVVAGTTNDWGRVPCDGATGYLMFQLDEETLALTVVHADWQDFNGWNDAHHDYFSGASTEDSSKKGTSAAQRDYLCTANRWKDDPATNEFWTERFAPNTWEGYDFYVPFETERSPNGFDVGEGMWVRGAYAAATTVAGMALQMAGQGRGWIQMTNPTESPRGLESVRFSARIAQAVSPDDFAYYEGGSTLNDYTFLTRAAFDLNANSNFTGNASLSLAAFYRPQSGCYEARWEQIDGNVQDGSGLVLGPRPCGQRLALYRWQMQGQEWVATELYAATNSDLRGIRSWKAAYSPNAIPQCHSVTNGGLMPFMIGAYDNKSKGYTVVVAAVHIPGVAKAAENVKGNEATATIGFLGSEQGWLYLVYRDASASRLTRGTYGVLSANCEGVFARPQYHPGIVSWNKQTTTQTLGTQIWPGAKASRGETATFYAASSAVECAQDIADGYWIARDGRMVISCGSAADPYTCISAAVVTQTVDVYTATLGTSGWPSEPVASKTLTGFGRPGVLQDASFDFWSTQDSSVRIRAGGSVRKNIRTDVVVDNIQISQWRGQDWLGSDSYEIAQGGPTNFVYTSGWIADGALQLSPRRTPDHHPCSLRVPLCDGKGATGAKRGLGLGSLSFRYRNAQSNACLLVQIATNGCNSSTLYDYTLDPGEGDLDWTTVTNFDFSAMTPEQRTNGVFSCSFGLHGVAGTVRILADNTNHTLRAQVKDVADPTAFGSVEIVSALFRDEPALDKGCWWGFNIRTVGDVSDVEQRMYLPDNPMRRTLPPLDEYGMSLALNNSITEDCEPEEVAKVPNPFRAHMPFLQTPTFASNVVGEVSFKARKYSLKKGSQCAEVSLYGTTELDLDRLDDRDWKLLNVFLVSNLTYETYRYKTDGSESYRVFRFAVTGVDGVAWPGHDPVCGEEPVRVLLDDVLVSEAVRARLAFRNTGAFRHDLTNTTHVADVPSTTEQPICGEGWGVQTEIYPAMLGDEVDKTYTPRVKLHYYKGTSPWGYSQWKSQGAGAWLTRATDADGYYRSSAVDSPGAVIPMSGSPEVVQWMLEVEYRVINPETGGSALATNWLESVDWGVPSWYHPVDYNATQGEGRADRFSAFTIVEPIAPGWAWINEINIFGEFNSSYRNSDRNKQFVEIVKPVDYDLNGWSLRMLAAQSYGGEQAAFLTNTVAIFGRNGVPKQKAGTAKCSYMSFIVVGNPTTTLTGTEYDGPWDNEWTLDKSVFCSGGELGSYYPVAIQLVRPSGIVEHEVTVVGTNAYESVLPAIGWQYSSTNLVRLVKANDPESTVFAVPDDNTSTATSVGIAGEDSEREKSALCWNNTMKMTPGEINEGQEISPAYPQPGGELIMVFAYVDSAYGHIVQTCGKGTNTTEMQTLTMTRGSEAGVRIKYTVEPWYELGTVTETWGGTTRTLEGKGSNRVYTVTVGRDATENVTVMASAAVDRRLREQYGLDANNRYTPAVLRWLQKGTDYYGNPFADTASCDIKLAKFLALSGNVVTNMTLTQMYWLDMDPTAGEMYFKAGMVRPPSTVVLRKPTYDPESDPEARTNLRLGVYMSISNGNGRVNRDEKVWAPYVLRGLGPDETSIDYFATGSSSGSWTSETFKVTGFLASGLSRTTNADAWIPLRYFVFGEHSFDANFESEIDVADPFSTSSPAYSEGWSRWVREVNHGVKPPVYMGWNIDTRLRPITAEVLAPTNRLDGIGQ